MLGGAQANLQTRMKRLQTLNTTQGQLKDIWEQMASKILNVFSDPVFFNVTKLGEWNLPEIIRHGMLTSGGMFYSQMSKYSTLMALRDLGGIGMPRISRRSLFSTRHMWRTFNHGMGCILVQGNYGGANCAGVSKRSWLHRHVRTIIFTDGTRLCWEDWIFHQDNAAIHAACRSKDFFQASNIWLLDHPPCSPTWTLSRNSEDGWQGTFIKMERSLRLWVLFAKLCPPHFFP